MSGFICPVCGFDGLLEPAYNEQGSGSFEICPSCGFEYGYDDDDLGVTHEEHLAQWLAAGAEWFDPEARPADWDLATQLARVGLVRQEDDDDAATAADD